MSFKINKSKDFCKEHEQYFEIQDMKAQLQEKSIAIRLKSSVARQRHCHKTLNVKSFSAMCAKCVMIDKHAMCVLKSVAKPLKKTVASESNKKPRNNVRKLYERVSKTCSWWYSKFTPSGYKWKPKSPTGNVNLNVSMPLRNASRTANVKDTMTSRHHTQDRASMLPQDSKKTHKRVSFSIGVIPTTSVSRPQLKSNPQGDRVLRSNSHGNKLEVEEHRRNVKLSKNKMFVTACNDSLNAKTLNVKYVSDTCDKRVMIDKHDLCVLKSVAKPLKKTDVLESNIKPRNNVRKLYEHVSKTCSRWYSKFSPSGYIWKPKSRTKNVNSNVSMPLGKASRTANVKDTMTSRRSIVSNTPLTMATTIEQQVALDEALVPSTQRFKMDTKKHIFDLESFREMLHISLRVPGQSFAELPFEEEILEFLRFLGHSAQIKTLTDVNVNKLYQPWRSFAAVINKCLTGWKKHWF
nr:hypothetical protein [Tanacetum cinerariifolium]